MASDVDPLKQQLLAARCEPQPKGTPPLAASAVADRLAGLPNWALAAEDPNTIRATFSFANFHETMAFVNAVAWIAHREDHHPELQVGYKTCSVSYTTHSIGGLSDNDFICAFKIEALLAN